MPLYYFDVNHARGLFLDREGTEVIDAAAARDHAALVAREIMRNDHHRCLSWRVRVCDAERRPCFELLFASVAEELDYLPLQFREAVQRQAARVASLKDDIVAVQMSLRQVRAMLAQADGLPYLAAVNGVRVDPPPPRRLAGRRRSRLRLFQ